MRSSSVKVALGHRCAAGHRETNGSAFHCFKEDPAIAWINPCCACGCIDLQTHLVQIVKGEGRVMMTNKSGLGRKRSLSLVIALMLLFSVCYFQANTPA